MEIIAKTDDGFIVKIEERELEMLTGYYYGKRRFRIGENIPVAKLYDQLNSLCSQDKNIKEISHKLKTAAGMLEKINPIFVKPSGDE